MRLLIKPASVLIVSLTLCGCIDYAKMMSHILADNMKQNAAACDAGYREACVRLIESGCMTGTNWPACRIAVDAQSTASTSLKTKCSQGDKGACYTLVRADCGKGDASACNVLKTTDPATLESEYKSGDQLACTDPPPGLYAAARMINGSQ